MAASVPAKATGSLRDRIAKFETTRTDVPTSPSSPTASRIKYPGSPTTSRTKFPVSPTTSRIRQPVHGKIPVARKASKGPSEDVSPLTTPVSPSAWNGAATKAVEKKAKRASVATPPEEQTVVVAPSSLDALLSPVASRKEALSQDPVHDPQRDEEPEEDDNRFSMVPLSGKIFDDEGNAQPIQGLDSYIVPVKAVTEESALLEHEATIAGPSSDDTLLNDEVNSHQKQDSESSGNVPFLIQQLDKHEELNDLSLGSNRQLQEEFTRLQNQKLNQDSEEEAGQIDWDFWGEVMADYHQYARENSDELARAIESGIPNSLRGMMWQLMSASKDAELEAEYARLLKEASSHEKAIMRDLGRTFPHHDFFMDGQGIGQENLFNVLKAYSLYDPDVGYCQGLPFIVAVLLLNMPDEEAFCLLVRLMATYGLRGHFLPEMPGLQLRLFQFDRLVEELLPVLHIHFLRQGVKSSMFCSQWFLTMFSYRFPLDVVFRIYDNVLATGIEAIFGFSIALLQKNEEPLLALKFDEILDYLRNELFNAYKLETNNDEPVYKVDEFVRDASLVRITPFMLDSYAHEYQDSVREREAHAVEVDSLRNINRNLSSQVKSLENSLAQLNTEHCEIVKQLVMARVQNEELEGELVRYKLLYADLMHQNEDAGSSHRLSSALNVRSPSK